MIKSFTFSDAQKRILKDCKMSHEEENNRWYLKNLFSPIIIVFLPIFASFLIHQSERKFLDLIFNGSLPLIGINVLFGMSSYLIKYDIGDDKNLVQETVNLRDKLTDFKNILVLVGGALYLYQALSVTELNFQMIVMAFLTFLILFFSIKIGHAMFIIKDDFVKEAYHIDEEISNKTKQLGEELDEYEQ